MKKYSDLVVAGLFLLGALIVSLAHVPGGVLGMIVIFTGTIIAPGYLLIRLFRIDLSDPFEIYPLSFVAGASLFSVWGFLLFLINARVDAAVPGMVIIGGALVVMNRRQVAAKESGGSFGGDGGLAWAALAMVLLVTLFAFVLGSFRGWGENWDYYTYIAMVRRLAESGVVANYPVEYAGESADPIHSYNVWALLWAATGRGARMDSIALYVKSAVLTVPAALLAFYYFSKALFNRSTALVALMIYGAYNALGLGLFVLGRTSFYNADPAWLIFFPVVIGMVWTYVNKGGGGMAILAMLASCGIFLLHPLWGALLVPAIGLISLLSLWRKNNSQGKFSNMSAIVGLVIFCIPVPVAIAAVATGTRFKFPGWFELWGGTGLFVALPFALASPWIIGQVRAFWKDETFRRSWIIMGLAIAAMTPFIVQRFLEIHGARPEIFTATHPFKRFIASRLFVLSFSNYTYTAPDMTFYPLSLLGILAIPWLLVKRKTVGPGALLVAAGIILIPFVATHPYLSIIFVKVTHMAYLRRALRVSAMFAACGGGALIAAAVLKRPRYAGFAATIAALVLGIACALYPYSPAYFQNALGKSWFVATNAPGPGLFWHPDYDAHQVKGTVWDKAEFSSLLDSVPAGDTVFSDRFTSYRIPAHRDLFVVCRMKPSAGVTDQAQRQKDQARFFRQGTTQRERCRILKKYNARWVLLNIDPDYRLREYYLGDPWTAHKLGEDSENFKRAGQAGPWVMYEALEACIQR